MHGLPCHPEAARYAGIVEPGRIADAYLFPLSADVPEIEMQARWFAGEFGREFRTTDGRTARIIQFGEWNHADGPDFVRAAVQIDSDEIEQGAIELDPRADDWERHGHSTNPAYDDVRLHVFFECPTRDFFTRTSEHRNVPQVALDPLALEGPPLVDVPAAIPGRCAPVLASLADDDVLDLIRSAAFFRLQRKAAQMARAIDAHGADQAIYQALAVALGYSRNKLPFLLLAQKLPLKALRQAPASPEAMLFGLSGFLDRLQKKAASPADTAYLKSLWEEWWKVRSSRSAGALQPSDWTLAGARPANHPQRRLAALAAIAHRWKDFRKALDIGGATAALDWLGTLDHPFWSMHYTLTSKPSPARMALIGDTRLLDIQTNVLLPFLHLSGREIDRAYLDTAAPLANRHVKTAAIRLLPTRKALASTCLRTVAGQQGLLEIYQSHCQRDLTDCTQCPFPERVGKTSGAPPLRK